MDHHSPLPSEVPCNPYQMQIKRLWHPLYLNLLLRCAERAPYCADFTWLFA